MHPCGFFLLTIRPADDGPSAGLTARRRLIFSSSLPPHVARVANELQGMSDEELTGVRQMKDAVAPGVFDEHMQGLQLGGGAPASE